MPAPSTPPVRPPAVVLVATEAAALLVLAGFLAVRSTGSDISDRGLLVGLAVFAAATAAIVTLMARGLARGSRWPRTPGYLVQFFAGIVALGLLSSGHLVTGLPLAAMVVATFVSLVRLGR